MGEQKELQQELNKHLPELSINWYKAVVCIDCDADRAAELHTVVDHLAQRTFALLCNQPFDDFKAQQLGQALAELDSVHADVLAASQAVLARQLLTGLPVAVPQSVVAQLLGNLAVGYFFQTQGRTGASAASVATRLAAELGAQASETHEAGLVSADDDLARVNRQLRDEIDREKQIADELRRYNRTLAVVNRASHAFYSTLGLDQVLTTILNELHTIIEVYAFSLWLVDDARNELVCYRTTDAHAEVMLGWRLPVGQGIAGQVAQSGKSLLVSDTRTNLNHFKQIDKQLGLEVRSILSVPLPGREKIIGVIQVVDTTPYRFDLTHQLLLESLVEAAGMAIENARLFDQSRRDVEAKSILLREVNHRVKNNLAVINGILHLKRSRIGPDDAASTRAITEDVMNHVQGLATVHSLLSKSNWTPLLLRELVEQVIETSLQVLSPHAPVDVRIGLSSVWVTADQSHDLALILNEIVTNAVKYALPQADGQLKINVNFGMNGTTARLEIKDNGPGFPPALLSLRSEHHNLGIELIKRMVRSGLEGEIALRNDHGAVVTIEFPLGVVNNG